MVHRPGVKHQIADAQLRLETDECQESQVADDIPILAIVWNLPVSPCDKEDGYVVCSVHDDGIQKTPTTTIASAVEMMSNVYKPPSGQELIGQQSMDDFCKTAAASVVMPGSQFTVDRSGFLHRQVSIDGALQKGLPKSLQARILHLFIIPYSPVITDCEECTTRYVKTVTGPE